MIADHYGTAEQLSFRAAIRIVAEIEVDETIEATIWGAAWSTVGGMVTNATQPTMRAVDGTINDEANQIMSAVRNTVRSALWWNFYGIANWIAPKNVVNIVRDTLGGVAPQNAIRDTMWTAFLDETGHEQSYE